jgi:uncharacterized repeat protein (TIGR03803 family)
MKHNRSFWSIGTVALALIIVIVTRALTPVTWAASKYRTLHVFRGSHDGADPASGLVFDTAGNLYGTTGDGGGNGDGTIFELRPNQSGGWTESRLYSFKGGRNGRSPHGGVIFDQAGNLYGATILGGATNSGTVFKLTPKQDGSWTKTLIYDFKGGQNGQNPMAGLVFDDLGNLYGTTLSSVPNHGTVFKLAPNADGSWTESVLYSFCSREECVDGSAPFAGLIRDEAGNLYGTTAGGGAHGDGTVFKITANSAGSWEESVLYSFCVRKACEDGSLPQATLTFDQTGNLYGTTTDGGDSRCQQGCGVVFELTPSSDGTWKESVLHRFTGGKGGAFPFSSGVIFDASGNLYGTTAGGGNLNDCEGGGCGVVFRLTPNSKGQWDETVLHVFVDHPGANPWAGLISDAAGNVYGTTRGDIGTTHGSVFEITP